MSEQEHAGTNADDPYNDGNLDARGVEPVAGEPQSDPAGAFETLDDGLDTSLRTDGTGGAPDVGQDDVAPERREGVD